MAKKLLIVGTVCTTVGAVVATLYFLQQKKIKDSTVIYMQSTPKAETAESVK